MKYRMPAMYEEFHCLGGDCPDNCCCIGWEVSIDEETAARYRALEGPLGDKLRETMVEADGEMQFPLTKGSCPFLDGDRLCSLHREYGEEFLCRTCREYPRFYQRIRGTHRARAFLLLSGSGADDAQQPQTDHLYAQKRRRTGHKTQRHSRRIVFAASSAASATDGDFAGSVDARVDARGDLF